MFRRTSTPSAYSRHGRRARVVRLRTWRPGRRVVDWLHARRVGKLEHAGHQFVAPGSETPREGIIGEQLNGDQRKLERKLRPVRERLTSELARVREAIPTVERDLARHLTDLKRTGGELHGGSLIGRSALAFGTAATLVFVSGLPFDLTFARALPLSAELQYVVAGVIALSFWFAAHLAGVNIRRLTIEDEATLGRADARRFVRAKVAIAIGLALVMLIAFSLLRADRLSDIAKIEGSLGISATKIAIALLALQAILFVVAASLSYTFEDGRLQRSVSRLQARLESLAATDKQLEIARDSVDLFEHDTKAMLSAAASQRRLRYAHIRRRHQLGRRRGTPVRVTSESATNGRAVGADTRVAAVVAAVQADRDADQTNKG